MKTTLYVFLSMVLALATSYPAEPKYVEVHEMDNHDPAPQSPQDPAVHEFPKEPTVPLLPNCISQGYFRDPFNCGKFYLCEFINAVPIAFYCQNGLIFNKLTDSCDHPQFVQC